MSRVIASSLVALTAIATISIASAQTDRAGSKDYPGISRMPGYYIDDYRESPFDSFTFKVKEGNGDKNQPVEGKYFQIKYALQKGGTAPSAIQIRRNYQNAARAAGGQVLYDDVGQGPDTTIRIAKSGTEVWLSVHISSIGPEAYFLNIIEKQAMRQEVTVDATAMAHDIGETGRVSIYGIYFDTGKAELKPESEPALLEIAKLLKQSPALRICVVGHTDMVGDLAFNVKLSQARAQAVVSALVSRHGVDGTRLVPFGNGSYAPVASNKTEEGRAKNRRVELVEIATK